MNKLNYRKTFLLGFGFLAISLMWSVYNAFMPMILKEYISSAAVIGFIMTIDNYLAIIIQPTVGTISDRINTRYGKRMPFIMAGMPVAAILLFLLANYNGLIMLLIFLVLTNLSMSIFRSPVISLMPDITHEENRSKANSIINFMGGIGALAAYFVGAILWKSSHKYPFYLSGIMMLLSFIILFIFIKEKRDVIGYEKSEDDGEGVKNVFKGLLGIRNILSLLLAVCVWIATFFLCKNALSMSIKHSIPLSTMLMLVSFVLFYLFVSLNTRKRKEILSNLRMPGKDRNVIFLLLAICSWFIAYQGVEAFLSLYGVEYLGVTESTAAMLFTFITLSFLIFAIPAGVVGTRLGKKKTITIGVGGLLLSFIALSMLKNINMVRVFLAVAGFFWAMININSYPFVAAMASKGEVGKYTGFYYFASSIAAILSPPLLGVIIDITGYRYMFVYAVIFLVLAFIFINCVKAGKGSKAEG